MPIVAPNEGLPALLDYILRDDVDGVADWELILFVNDITPDQDTEYADLTEATFTGYSSVTVTRGDWTAAVIDSDVAVSTWGAAATTWTNTGSEQTVYGYAMVTATSPVIRLIERFASPVVLATNGILGLLPRVTLGTAPAP